MILMTPTDGNPNRADEGRSRRGKPAVGVLRVVKSLPFLSVHLGCLAVFFTGVDRPALMLCAATYLARMFGITAGYHRYFSHRSYRTSRPFQLALALLGCSA